MARIRTIKPEFWSDEKLAPMPVATRLLFLALICMADDCGRIIDSVSQIVAFMHPYTDDETFANVSRETRESLANLTGAGRIVRGSTASGQRVIQIVNWTRHQKVDHPNTKAALPEVVAVVEDTTIRESLASNSREIRESLATDSRDDLRPTTYDQRPTTIPASRKKPRDTAPVENWVSTMHDWWVLNIGAVQPSFLGNKLKPLRTTYTDEQIREAAKVYFSPEEGPRYKTLPDFATTFAQWHTTAVEPVVRNGVPTARGEKILRAPL